jgi:hypothetical protein
MKTKINYTDVFNQRHGRLVQLAATIVLAVTKSDAPRITKRELVDKIKTSSSLRLFLKSIKEYRIADWLSTANVMGAFRDYSVEIRPGVGFTRAEPRTEDPVALNQTLVKEQRNFAKELVKIRRSAGL